MSDNCLILKKIKKKEYLNNSQDSWCQNGWVPEAFVSSVFTPGPSNMSGWVRPLTGCLASQMGAQEYCTHRSHGKANQGTNRDHTWIRRHLPNVLTIVASGIKSSPWYLYIHKHYCLHYCLLITCYYEQTPLTLHFKHSVSLLCSH